MCRYGYGDFRGMAGAPASKRPARLLLQSAGRSGSPVGILKPDLTAEQRQVAKFDGWILRVV
jgi:hypothetical protein